MSSSPTMSLSDMMQQQGLGEQEPPLYDQQDQGQFGGDQAGSDVYGQAPPIGQMPSDDDVMNAAGPEHGEAILNAHRDVQQSKADLQDAQLNYLGKTAEAIKAADYHPDVAAVLFQHVGGDPDFADHVNQIQAFVQQNPQALPQIVDSVIDSANGGSSQGTEEPPNSEAEAEPAEGGDEQDTEAGPNGDADPDASASSSPAVGPSQQASQQPQQKAARPQQGQQPARPQLPPPPLPPPPPTAGIEGIRRVIGDVASSKENNTDYLVGKSKANYKAGSDKCNEFVADSIEEAGLPRPQIPYTNEGVKGKISNAMGRMRDPSANEWANPNVKIPGWSEPRPLSEAKPGDVIAQQHGTWGHVGIVAPRVSQTGGPSTTSASTAVLPQGKVTISDWGFRTRGQNGEDMNKDPYPVVRHYTGK